MWGGTSPHSAESLLSDGFRSGPSEEDKAVGFLRSTLADGPKKSTAVGQAREAAGISKRTFERAKASLSVVSKPRGMGGEWYMALPEHVEKREKNVERRKRLPEKLANSDTAKLGDSLSEARSSESASVAESGAPSEETGESVRHSVRRVGELSKNGLGEGITHSSSSSVRHLHGKAGSQEEHGPELPEERVV